MCGQFDSLKLILAPHEPSEQHVGQLTSFCEQHALSYQLYSSFSAPDSTDKQVSPSTRAVIVDTIGALAAVYRAADMTYVGGSFSTGVHNTMEPACFALPLLFGPRHLNSYEARLMIDAGGAFAVNNRQDIIERAGRLIGDETYRKACGEAARRVVKSNLGATDKTMLALAEAFPGAIPHGAERVLMAENDKKIVGFIGCPPERNNGPLSRKAQTGGPG